MELDKAIKERHSVRRFSTKKPSYEDVIEAIYSATLAPLAGNISTLRFILVTEKEKIKQLEKACQQDFVSSVSLVLVVCSDTTLCTKSYGERGEIYARQQAGAAIENFLLRITDLNLATCWIGAFVDSMARHALGIPDSINVEAIFPIGYEFGKSKQRKKNELNSVLFFNKWKNKYLKPVKKPEAS